MSKQTPSKKSYQTPKGLPSLDRLAERLQQVDLWEVDRDLTKKEREERRRFLEENA